MFELTNEQRECFALVPVSDGWERLEVKASPYDNFKTYIYLEGDTVVKCILSGDAQYSEFEVSEKVSPDKRYLLPKTAKGKPVLLSSSNILKRTETGMHLGYREGHIGLRNANAQCCYYTNGNLKDNIRDLKGFIRWVEKWCSETTDADRADVCLFSQRKRRHVRFREGDVFRFKIGRRLYGYGRILLDYAQMRKNKEPFWDILMTKPLVCSVYHIANERDDVSAEELKTLKSLPSQIMMDNPIYYGEYEIIGHLPITEWEDYPILYGGSISVGDEAVCYQCGKVYRRIEGGRALYRQFINNGVSFRLNFNLDILMQCIKENSNRPYWENSFPWKTDQDLRNPKFSNELKKVKAQFGL